MLTRTSSVSCEPSHFAGTNQTYTGSGLLSQTISRVRTEPVLLPALQNRPVEEAGMLPGAEVLINVRQAAV